MVPVTIIYYSKILVSHEYLDSEVVVELKVWEVEKLIEDFYSLVRARGYSL